jgi:hypothetical protein
VIVVVQGTQCMTTPMRPGWVSRPVLIICSEISSILDTLMNTSLSLGEMMDQAAGLPEQGGIVTIVVIFTSTDFGPTKIIQSEREEV